MAAQYEILNTDIKLPIIDDAVLKDTLTRMYQESLKDPSKETSYICYRNNETFAFLRIHLQQPFQFWYYDLDGRVSAEPIKNTIREFVLTHGNTQGRFEQQYKDIGLADRHFNQPEFLRGGAWNHQAHIVTPAEIYQKLVSQTPVKSFEQAPRFFSKTPTHAPTPAVTPTFKNK